MASGSVNEVPTVDKLLERRGLMQHTLLRVIRNTAADRTLEVPARLAKIAWLADTGLCGPVDEESRALYEHLARELERAAGMLWRVRA